MYANYYSCLAMFVSLIFFITHLAPSIRSGPIIAPGVLLNLNILRECIALTHINDVLHTMFFNHPQHTQKCQRDL